jgi:tetrahydromethanopterin S-methyltransferase subunit G
MTEKPERLEHVVCQQDERIRALQQRVDKLEEKTNNIEKLLDKFDKFQEKVTWGLIGLFGTSIGTLVVSLILAFVIRK